MTGVLSLFGEPVTGLRRMPEARAAPRTWGSGRVDALRLVLDAVDEAVDVVRLAEERLQRGDHDGRREAGVGVAVEVLRDALRRADQLGGLLLEWRVRRGVRLTVRHQRRGVVLGIER